MTSARSFSSTPPVACVLADGMGGHAAGDLAGRLAAERLGQLLRDGDMKAVPPAIHTVNAEMLAETRTRPEVAGMGAAVVGLLITQREIGIFNVGDSRAYRVEPGKLVQLSEDDSADKNWTPGSLFARSGMLTQALGGGAQEVMPHLRIEPATDGATYLLCCDGVYETLDDEQILANIGTELALSADSILREALRCYAADNVSLILARVVTE